MYQGISVDKTFNQSTSSLSSCLHENNNDELYCFDYQDYYDFNMQITLKCILKFEILQLIQCFVKTDNNDVCVRDVDIKMQMIFSRSAKILIWCLQSPMLTNATLALIGYIGCYQDWYRIDIRWQIIIYNYIFQVTLL